MSHVFHRDPRLSYTALGHIHKPQNVNEGGHPPVIYPGSIERIEQEVADYAARTAARAGDSTDDGSATVRTSAALSGKNW